MGPDKTRWNRKFILHFSKIGHVIDLKNIIVAVALYVLLEQFLSVQFICTIFFLPIRGL